MYMSWYTKLGLESPYNNPLVTEYRKVNHMKLHNVKITRKHNEITPLKNAVVAAGISLALMAYYNRYEVEVFAGFFLGWFLGMCLLQYEPRTKYKSGTGMLEQWQLDLLNEATPEELELAFELSGLL